MCAKSWRTSSSASASSREVISARLRVALERAHDVAHLAVDLRGERGLGEPRPDRRGDIGRGRALGHLLHRTVGKRDLEHPGHCASACSERLAGSQPRLPLPCQAFLIIAVSRPLWGGESGTWTHDGGGRERPFDRIYRLDQGISADRRHEHAANRRDLVRLRSWAKAGSRRYLWSRTWFIDDELAWTGTGKEMFIGFIAAVILLGTAALADQLRPPRARHPRRPSSRDRLPRAPLSHRLLPLQHRALPGAPLPPVAHLVASHQERQRQSGLVHDGARRW